MTLQMQKSPFTYRVRGGQVINTDVIRFYRSVPSYQLTPLYRLTNLAHQYGVGEISVKDEGQRFGLEAFKGVPGACMRWPSTSPVRPGSTRRT